MSEGVLGKGVLLTFFDLGGKSKVKFFINGYGCFSAIKSELIFFSDGLKGKRLGLML
jgi:hypothetical protein